MRIIISPAKRMKIDNDVFFHRQMPRFMEESQVLLDYLQTLNYEKIKSMWKCSDKLARENFDIVKNVDLNRNLTPGIFSFQGLQYQYMGAGIFTDKELDYIEEHLRILSGFYGIIKPFDGIVPYRLEMQSKFSNWEYGSLYDFWGDKIAKSIFSETDCIINLASMEYSKSISKYITEDTSIITCVFGELIDGKVKEKGTLAKMARGEMVRFMAEKKVERAEDIKSFHRMGYVYREELSDGGNFVFIKK